MELQEESPPLRKDAKRTGQSFTTGRTQETAWKHHGGVSEGERHCGGAMAMRPHTWALPSTKFALKLRFRVRDMRTATARGTAARAIGSQS